jgi:hypothetical protein
MLPVSTLIIVSIGYLTKRNHHRLSNRVFIPTEPFSLRVLRIEKFRIDPQNTQRIAAPLPRRARRPTTAAGRLPTAAANSCSKASTWKKRHNPVDEEGVHDVGLLPTRQVGRGKTDAFYGG